MSEPNPIKCVRCGETRPALPRPPFRNEIGERIHAEICPPCWAEWLQHQTALINHHGLDPRDASAREFLYAQIDAVLFNDGEDGAAEIDTSKEGSIEWPGPS